MNSEIAGYKRAITRAQEEGENLNIISTKLENETDFIRRQIEDLNDQRDKLSETYTVYSKSLEQADKEMIRFQQERASVQMGIYFI
jgi:coiled-coil domain-containing protein 40